MRELWEYDSTKTNNAAAKAVKKRYKNQRVRQLLPFAPALPSVITPALEKILSEKQHNYIIMNPIYGKGLN